MTAKSVLGTTAPAAKLDVTGDVIFRHNSDSPAGYAAGTDLAVFGSHNSTGTLFEVFTQGDVSRFKILGSGATTLTGALTGTSATFTSHITLSNNYAVMWEDGNNLIAGSGSGGGNYLNFNTSGSERMRIIANGNVGIGTTAPATLFDAKSSRTHNFIGRFVNTSTVGWGAYIEGGGDSADYSLLIRNQASSDLFAIMGDGEIRVANQTLVDNANTNYKMTFPDNSGIAMGSAYTFANIYGSSGNLYLRANAYPANTGSTSKIYLQTANSSGGQASDVVVNNG